MNANKSVIRLIEQKINDLNLISCVLSEAKRFVDDNHGTIREHRFSMQNCGDTADPLGRITIGADTGFCTRRPHVEAFSPHGSGNIFHSLNRCMQVCCQLVDTGNNHDFAGTEGHGIGAVPYTFMGLLLAQPLIVVYTFHDTPK